MGDVESALGAPAPGREGAWRRDLGVKLAALSEALEWHIAGTEGDGGLLAEIAASAPRLTHRLDRARTDHGRLHSDLSRLCAAVDAADAEADVAVLRDDVLVLLTDLARHVQLASDLVYDAYSVDIEAAD
jgi:hypothetical protein